MACWEGMDSTTRAHTSLLFNQRIKLSFASEPNSVLFYCLPYMTLGRRTLVGALLDQISNSIQNANAQKGMKHSNRHQHG